MKLDDKIPVAHGVKAMLADFREFKQFGGKFPVEGKPGSRQGSGTKRHNIDSFIEVLQPPGIPVEHFVIGKEIVGKEDRLGFLKMGIPGHDHLKMLFGLGYHRLLEFLKEEGYLLDSFPEIKTEIQRHLVIPASARMKFFPGMADFFNQP